MYFVVEFIRMGLLELQVSRVERELQYEKFLLTVGFKPDTLRLQSGRANHYTKKIWYPLSNMELPECAITYKTDHVVDVVNVMSWITLWKLFIVGKLLHCSNS